MPNHANHQLSYSDWTVLASIWQSEVTSSEPAYVISHHHGGLHDHAMTRDRPGHGQGKGYEDMSHSYSAFPATREKTDSIPNRGTFHTLQGQAASHITFSLKKGLKIGLELLKKFSKRQNHHHAVPKREEKTPNAAIYQPKAVRKVLFFPFSRTRSHQPDPPPQHRRWYWHSHPVPSARPTARGGPASCT